MIDYENYRIIHQHGNDWAEFHPRKHHDASDHDPERDWDKGARIFRCESCDEEIRIVPREGDTTER